VEDLQGWNADPIGRHEERYFSQGEPTKLVRDGGRESYDEVITAPGSTRANGIDGQSDFGVLPASVQTATAHSTVEVTADTLNPPPDWYPDPADPSGHRFWNGSRWTELAEEATLEPVRSGLTADPSEALRRTAPRQVGQLGGWRPDQSGRHGFRYFSHGQPTALVSDGDDQVSFDELPGATEPQTVEAVDAPPFQSWVPTMEETVEPPGPPADWYPDPDDPHRLRFWDGSAWTDHRRLLVPEPDGWQIDPTGSYEFRYYSGGDPTSWVSTAGHVHQGTDSTIQEPVSSGAGATGATIRHSEPTAAAAWFADPDPVNPDRVRYWDGDQWTEHTASLSQPRQPQLEHTSGPEHVLSRRTKVAIALFGVAAVLIAVIALGILTTTTAPQTRASTTSAWWTSAGQPDTTKLSADIQAIERRLGSAGALSTSCHALSDDVMTAASAPKAPTPRIEQEWQLTVSSASRAADACLANRYPQMIDGLKTATSAIQGLDAQLNSHQ
jgi:hypothetical protein